MKALFTKYHGPTNTLGPRITASDEDGNRVTIPYDDDLRDEAVHAKAVVALCRKMNWPGTLMRGGMKQGYVFVFVDERDVVRVEP